MAELHDKERDSISPWWPMFALGLSMPVLREVFEPALPPYAAVGVSFFVAWAIAGMIFQKFPPHQTWQFGRWIVGGAGGAFLAGAVKYLFDWQ